MSIQNKLRDLIVNNKIEEAINLVIDLLGENDKELSSTMIILKSQFKDWKNKYLRGEKYDRQEKSRIISILLEIVNEIDEGKNIRNISNNELTKSTVKPFINVRSLSVRNRELLNVLTNHSFRTRYIWVILNLFSLILLTSTINEKLGGNRTRIEARHWNTLNEELDKINNKQSSIEKQLINDFLEIDNNEESVLRKLQLNEFEITKLPILGLSFSASDASFIFAIGLIIIYVWYFLGVSKERTVLSQILYPLVATIRSNKAKKMWGKKNSNNEMNLEDLNKKIESYKLEILELRETISSKFLTLYSSPRRRIMEFVIAFFLIFFPVLALTISVSTDWYWDFGKKFGTTGMSYMEELNDYSNSIITNIEAKFQDPKLKEKLLKSKKEIESLRTQILFKRIFSTVCVSILLIVSLWIYFAAKGMTKILTNMYNDPEKLDIERYVDV